MKKIATAISETQKPDPARRTIPVGRVVVLLVSLMIVGMFTTGGDLLEDAMSISQEDISSTEEISPSCSVLATLRFVLPDLSKRGEAT